MASGKSFPGIDVQFEGRCPRRLFIGLSEISPAGVPLGRVDLPGFVSDGVNHLAWIVDTSSSIDLEALARAGAEGQAVPDEGAVDKITVVYCDAAVKITLRNVLSRIYRCVPGKDEQRHSAGAGCRGMNELEKKPARP